MSSLTARSPACSPCASLPYNIVFPPAQTLKPFLENQLTFRLKCLSKRELNGMTCESLVAAITEKALELFAGKRRLLTGVEYDIHWIIKEIQPESQGRSFFWRKKGGFSESVRDTIYHSLRGSMVKVITKGEKVA